MARQAREVHCVVCDHPTWGGHLCQDCIYLRAVIRQNQYNTRTLIDAVTQARIAMRKGEIQTAPGLVAVLTSLEAAE